MILRHLFTLGDKGMIRHAPALNELRNINIEWRYKLSLPRTGPGESKITTKQTWRFDEEGAA
jgi:hypothetical protein